jgi:hypothetical protein
MCIRCTNSAKILVGGLMAFGLLAGSYVAGQNRFGQPKTIIHVVTIQWNPGVSDAEKQHALNGVKEMATKIPGIKNVWIKGDRIQPREFNAAFAIEFASRDAADAYAESSIHKAWDDAYIPLRAASISVQVTNP